MASIVSTQYQVRFLAGVPKGNGQGRRPWNAILALEGERNFFAKSLEYLQYPPLLASGVTAFCLDTIDGFKASFLRLQTPLQAPVFGRRH